MAKTLTNPEHRLQVGDIAPEFALDNQDGVTLSLSQLVSAKAGLVLYFYPKDDTPGCTKEACEFSDANTAISKLGYGVVGISPDPPSSHSAFASKYGLGFPLLSDPTYDTISAYGVYGTKMLYGKEIVGLLRSTFIINHSAIIQRALYNVKATGHATRIHKILESIVTA